MRFGYGVHLLGWGSSDRKRRGWRNPPRRAAGNEMRKAGLPAVRGALHLKTSLGSA